MLELRRLETDFINSVNEGKSKIPLDDFLSTNDDAVFTRNRDKDFPFLISPEGYPESNGIPPSPQLDEFSRYSFFVGNDGDLP
jgi:hypothetical protein